MGRDRKEDRFRIMAGNTVLVQVMMGEKDAEEVAMGRTSAGMAAVRDGHSTAQSMVKDGQDQDVGGGLDREEGTGRIKECWRSGRFGYLASRRRS